ncbi:DsbA family protein [Amycolatopsis nigrescens]|uniref:DsbA family protein n=1 Tax=Amycolatopsis nigrescens TaxID=381445 RepID=UPI0012F83054|nr:DsbA family protein [Amycolatopsis nigrescens]
MIEVFEDYLCPHSAHLEISFGERFMRMAEQEPSEIAIYPVAIFDSFSRPAMYSTRCARLVINARARKSMMAVRRGLLLEQPPQLGAAELYSDERIISALLSCGIQQGLARELLSLNTGQEVLDRNIEHLRSISPPRILATPTVVIDGTTVPPDDHLTVLGASLSQ